MSRICFGLTVLFILAGCSSSPKDCLIKAQRAAFDHDYSEFCKYVDVDGILATCIEDIDGAANPFVMLAQPRLTEIAKDKLKRRLENDSLRLSHFGSKIIRTDIDGSKAVMQVTVYYDRYKMSIPASIRFRRVEDRWQIAEIGLDSIRTVIEQIQNAKIDSVNIKIAEMRRDMLKMGMYDDLKNPKYGYLERAEISKILLLTDYLLEDDSIE